ncbi:MAG TPA: TolC family protein, partial [Chitinivibrionales bacterium]
MKKIGLMALLVFLTQTMALGQVFSLKQCIDYALSNNGNIKIGHYDESMAQKKVNEQIGTMLPQIAASGSIDDNLKVATQLMPGELFGNPGSFVPVQMGTKYSVSAGVQVDQKIYDQTFWVGLKAAGISRNQSRLNLQKIKEQTVYSVSRTYYQTLVIQKQSNVLKATIDALTQSLKATELKCSNGLTKKIDVDKVRVSFNTTQSQLQQTELSYKQSLNNLKYQMGMPLDSTIFMTDGLLNLDSESIEKEPKNDNYHENRIDYQLQKTNLQLQEADRSRNLAAYLPSLSFNAKYNYQAMPSDLNSDMTWYDNSSIGLRLSIPLFDGLQKSARLAQSKLSIEKAKENITLTEQSIKVDVSNYEIQYRNAIDNIKSEKENLSLAEDVYTNTRLEYQQGTSSSFDLVQAESSLRETQENYFNRLLNLFIARLDLEQSK